MTATPLPAAPAAGPSGAPSEELRSDVPLVAAATVIGLFARLWLASRTEAWLDEAYSVLLAVAPLRDLVTTLALDTSPPLYYLVLKAWSLVAPFDPLWLRVPSLLVGCAAIPAIWMVGARMDRPRTGVIAAWLVALSPLHAYYSEEIRMYAMLTLLGLLFYFAVFHVLSRTGRILPAVLAGAALAYTHYYGLIFAGAALLVALAVLAEKRRQVLFCGTAIAITFLPWLPVFLVQLGNPRQLNWMADFWVAYPGAIAILRTLQAFMPGGLKYPFVPIQGIDLQVVVIGLGILPFLALALRSDRKTLFRPMVVPALVLMVTLLILVVRSYTASPIYLAGRSDVVVFPLFVLALAMALSRRGHRSQLLFLTAWTVLAGLEFSASAESLKKSGNVEIAQSVTAAGCRVVVATGLSYASVLVYQMFEEDGARVVPFPIDMSEHPGNLNPANYTAEQLVAEANILAREFPPGEGLCVMVATPTFSGPLADAYLEAGAIPEEVGVYQPSLMPGSSYVLVTLSTP